MLDGQRREEEHIHAPTGFWKYIDDFGYIHPSSMLHRTVTGRTASADPNGQNFPKRGPLAKAYRKIFVARPGYTYVECDLSQAELRIAAWMAQEPTMLRIYQENGDIHMATAVIVSGLTQEAFDRLSEETRKEYRQKAKAVIFFICNVYSALRRNRIMPRFLSGPNHPRWIDKSERLELLRSLDLGSLRVVSSEISERRIGNKSRQYVRASCSACGQEHEILVDNLVGRKTTNCRCQRRKKYLDPRATILGERYDAIVQRCYNPRSPSYKNYGDIGIECRFSREEFISYMLKVLPHADYRGVDIDRIDNNGHYTVDNLRLATRAVNLRNKSTNRLVVYKGNHVVAADLWSELRRDYPEFTLSQTYTARLAADGVAWPDILKRKPRAARARKPVVRTT